MESRGQFACFPPWIRTALGERRQAPRHESGAFHVLLGWWKGGRVFTVATAELLSLHSRGALVRLASPPSALREVWIDLGEFVEAEDCFGATTVELARIHESLWLARLEFELPCTQALVDAVLSDAAQQRAAAPQASPRQRDFRGLSTPPPQE